MNKGDIMNNQEKCCNNCHYYLRHYVKSSLGLHQVCCGHCTFDFKHLRKKYLPDSVCENWKKNNRQAEHVEKVKNYIKNVSNRLDEFAILLENKK